jgi:hypothetical protein
VLTKSRSHREPFAAKENNMIYRLHNEDLRILQAEGRRPRFNLAPGWQRVDWKPTESGGNMIFLRQFVLPPTCSVRRTDVKLEAPPNLYEPVGHGRLAFYRNVWISPDIRLFDARKNTWVSMPRLHARDVDGFAYWCVHAANVRPGKNILHFLKALDLFALNPGYKAAGWEAA